MCICACVGLAVWCVCAHDCGYMQRHKVNVGSHPLCNSLRQNFPVIPQFLATAHLAGQLALQMGLYLCFLRLELQASRHVGSGVRSLVFMF